MYYSDFLETAWKVLRLENYNNCNLIVILCKVVAFKIYQVIMNANNSMFNNIIFSR